MIRSTTFRTVLLLAVTSWTGFILGQQEDQGIKLRKSFHSAEASQDNLAVLFRLQGIRFTGNKPNRPNIEHYFRVRTKLPNAEDRGNFLLSSTKLVGDIEAPNEPPREMREIHAQLGNRVFLAIGGSQRNLVPKEVTTQMQDKDFAAGVDYEYRGLNKNIQALPFMTVDAIQTGRSDFPDVLTRYTTCSLSYETEAGLFSVWENLKHGVVLTITLSKDYDNLPVEAAFYHRNISSDRLAPGEKFGERVYQTATEWMKIDVAKPDSERKGNARKQETKWVPKRIIMERFPHSSNPSSHYGWLELVAAWESIADPELLTEETILKKKEPDPIALLYARLEQKLAQTIAESELKTQRKKR